MKPVHACSPAVLAGRRPHVAQRASGRRVLRLLRGQGRHQALQPGLAGRARARRRPHRPHDGQRLQGRPEGVRGRGSGADVHSSEARSTWGTRRSSTISTPTRRRGSSSTSTTIPCDRRRYDDEPESRLRWPTAARSLDRGRAKALGVTIEAHYTVGEYDILILSANAERAGSRPGCARTATGSRPAPAPVLGSYIKQNMRFFVAKVNLKEQAKLGFTFLRPLQVAYESPKFMLPIRLGTRERGRPAGPVRLRADAKGRVETDQLPDGEAPHRHGAAAVREGRVHGLLQRHVREQVRRQDMRAVFLEYAWDMAWCDPCAADPLSRRSCASSASSG